jgi:DDE superfamily endonuclease
VTQPVDVGFNTLLKKYVKDKFRAWQIQEYLANNSIMKKLPSPTILDVIVWVSYAYNNISEETI